MEGHRDSVAAAASSLQGIVRVEAISDHRLIRLILLALIENMVGLCRLEHDRVPGFSRRTAKQGQESGAEALKVHMLTHLAILVQVDKGELGHADDGEHEDEEEEKQAECTHGRESRNEGLEYLLQPLLLLHQAEDS